MKQIKNFVISDRIWSNFIIGDLIIHAKYMKMVHSDFEACNQEVYWLSLHVTSAKPWPKYRI